LARVALPRAWPSSGATGGFTCCDSRFAAADGASTATAIGADGARGGIRGASRGGSITPATGAWRSSNAGSTGTPIRGVPVRLRSSSTESGAAGIIAAAAGAAAACFASPGSGARATGLAGAGTAPAGLVGAGTAPAGLVGAGTAPAGLATTGSGCAAAAACAAAVSEGCGGSGSGESSGERGGSADGCMPMRCITRETEGGGMLSRRRAISSSITSPVSSPPRSASTIRVVVANRFSGSFASILVTAASIHSGTPRRCVGSGCGTSVTCLVRMSNTRLPPNGGAPVSISYATQPSW
jgi:hypothetical protein